MTHDPDMIDVNPEWLTLAEIDKVEEMLGAPIDNMSKMPRRGQALRVIATVIRQRSDPSFTLDQSGNLKIRMGSGKDDEAPPVPPTSGDGSGTLLSSPITTD